MRFVVDANLAIKWFVNEAHHDAAMWLAAYRNDLCAPDLIVLEAANVALRKVRDGEISEAHAFWIVPALRASFSRLYAAIDLLGDAVEIAVDLKHPIYDCIYLACARQAGVPLVTADKQLVKRVRRSRWSDLIADLDHVAREMEHEDHKRLPGLAIRRMDVYRVIRAAALLRVTEQTINIGRGLKGDARDDEQPDPDYWQMIAQSPARRQLVRIIESLSATGRRDLFALFLRGRDKDSAWRTLIDQATHAIHGGHDIEQLAASPATADHLAAGLKARISAAKSGR